MDFYDTDLDVDDGLSDSMYYTDEPEFTLADLYTNCLVPTLRDGIGAAAILLPTCIVFRLVIHANILPRNGVHILSALAGICCLYHFFAGLASYVASFAMFGIAVLLSVDLCVKRLRGLICSAACIAFVVVCELYLVDATSWHRVRGPQMIIAMKLISLALDVDSGSYKLPSLLHILGYVFHVGTSIFGPWVGFSDYDASIDAGPVDVLWSLSVGRCFLLSYMSLTVSTCWASWLLPFGDFRWPAAYRDAMSFRFSHYFISFLSETTAVASGITQAGSLDLAVTSPKDVEIPRSLVEVVIHWNRSMHTWLRQYVFKATRPLGNFTAILLTYAASSLLHGINFQLAAVLLSLGFYTYTEFVLRQKLATVFDACIGARRCKPHCDHRYKSDHPAVFGTNLFFGLLSVFHLAYLGVMFDAAPQLQEQGYSMSHTLSKWSELKFASHWVALATFLFYLLV